MKLKVLKIDEEEIIIQRYSTPKSRYYAVSSGQLKETAKGLLFSMHNIPKGCKVVLMNAEDEVLGTIYKP